MSGGRWTIGWRTAVLSGTLLQMARLARKGKAAYQLVQGRVNQVHGDRVWKKLCPGMAILESKCL
uniref:Transmembrane protein n=1 Tax=Medicago truncatula TaxID=3880 RepID=A4PRI8_MEDTR|nr:hypothetical protein MtrDRAFT_AC139526g54v2 [Medicago truncatula]